MRDGGSHIIVELLKITNVLCATGVRYIEDARADDDSAGAVEWVVLVEHMQLCMVGDGCRQAAVADKQPGRSATSREASQPLAAHSCKTRKAEDLAD